MHGTFCCNKGPDSLVVGWQLLLGIDGLGLLNQVMSLILQLLSHPYLTSVEPLDVVGVDQLRGSGHKQTEVKNNVTQRRVLHMGEGRKATRRGRRQKQVETDR